MLIVTYLKFLDNLILNYFILHMVYMSIDRHNISLKYFAQVFLKHR